MTRKTCNNNTHIGIGLDSVCDADDVYGYDHSRLRCRRTVAHQRFTRGNSRFLHIDDLYRSDSTITKLFLKINDIALNQTLNNSKPPLPTAKSKSTTMTRNKLPRRQTSLYDKIKSPASPTRSDSCFQLRTRRHTSFVNNFIDSSGDDDSNHIKPMRELRSTSKLLLTALKTSEQTASEQTWDSGRPKRQIKPRRFSTDEPIIVNNKDCFKGDAKKSKLRVSHNEKIRVPQNLKVYTSDSEEEKRLLATKKKRESELTRLNNEAESFLFPKNKDETSSIDSEDNTHENSRKAIPVSNKDFINDISNNKVSRNFKSAHEDESRDSTSSEASSRTRKRRLTQAEAFILDNQQYYKFETPGSRLRYHGTYLPPLVVSSGTSPSHKSTLRPSTATPLCNKINGDLVSKQKHKAEEPTKRVKRKYNLDRLKFSFEVVPRYEPWYETFQRQDTGQETYTNCYNTSSEEPILLPYELGTVPPLNPRLCFYAYQEVKKSFLGETNSPSTHHGNCSTPDSCSRDTTNSKTDDTSTGDDTQSSADLHSSLDTPFNLRRRTRYKSRRVGVSSKTPRKSPRQHASTLAILSSLINRKRKPKPVLPVIEEEKDSKPDYNEISTFFNTCLDDLDVIEEEPEGIDFNAHCKPSAVRTLEEYLDEPIKPKSISKQLLDRKAVRKKRTNKTGWPNKSKRSAFKKEGSHSSGSIIESLTDSPSKNDDSKENKINGIKSEIEAKSSIVESSTGDRRNCVNVDLAKWETAERLLTSRLSDFQPIVRVQKLANNVIERRNTTVPCSRPKRSMPASPKSPRMLRRPRDKFN